MVGNYHFMDEKDVYIINPRYFEYAFDYTDHITEISQNNIEEIASMSFFPDNDTRESFKSIKSSVVRKKFSKD